MTIDYINQFQLMEYLITSGINEAPPEASKLSNYIVTSLKTSNLKKGHSQL
jgi:hypothetical protein